MTIRIITLLAAAALTAGCSQDILDPLRDRAAIAVTVTRARDSGEGAEFIARAESPIARHPALLRAAAWAKSGAHCGEKGFVPLGDLPELSESSPARTSFEQPFMCSEDRLPNDERVPAQVIYDDEWPAPIPGAKVKSGWASYGAPSRPYIAFTQFLGSQVAGAYEACGNGSFVIERIESRTQSGAKPEGQPSQSRVHGVRLQYRCIDREAAGPVPGRAPT